MRNRTKGFTLIEVLIVIIIIGVLASLILVSTIKSRNRAREAKYIAYVAQVKNLVDGLAQSGDYDNVPGGTIGCLGDYTYGAGTCWDDKHGTVINNVPILDNILKHYATFPHGEFSPYNSSFGVFHFKKNNSGNPYIGVTAFIGQDEWGEARTSDVCDKFFGKGEWVYGPPSSIVAYCSWYRYLNK